MTVALHMTRSSTPGYRDPTKKWAMRWRRRYSWKNLEARGNRLGKWRCELKGNDDIRGLSGWKWLMRKHYGVMPIRDCLNNQACLHVHLWCKWRILCITNGKEILWNWIIFTMLNHPVLYEAVQNIVFLFCTFIDSFVLWVKYIFKYFIFYFWIYVGAWRRNDKDVVTSGLLL